MPWFARRLITVNGKTYDTGDEIPAEEVETWTNLSSYVDKGWVSGAPEKPQHMGAGPHDDLVDPATEGARQTFPREWPPADRPPTLEPVGNAASSPFEPGPPGPEAPMAVAPQHVDEVEADIRREDSSTAAPAESPKQGVEKPLDEKPVPPKRG